MVLDAEVWLLSFIAAMLRILAAHYFCYSAA